MVAPAHGPAADQNHETAYGPPAVSTRSFPVRAHVTSDGATPASNDSVFRAGDGHDTIQENDAVFNSASNHNEDTLSFEAGVAPSDVTWARTGNDLVLTLQWRGGSDHHLVVL